MTRRAPSSELDPQNEPGRTPGPTAAPKLPAALLERLIGPELGPLVRGDLDEEYRAHAVAERGRWRARLWYWRQVGASCIALRSQIFRRLAARKPIPSSTGRTLPPPCREHAVLQTLFDLRFAFRSLRQRPGSTAAAVLTLALGIGATTAIWSVVDAVLLEPLPYAREAELVRLGPDSLFPFSMADARFLQEKSTRLAEVAAWGRSLFVLRGEGGAEEVRGAAVFDNHFSSLGARPLLGRGFLPEEGLGDAASVAVLAHGLWQRRFGGDPGILGRQVAFSGGATRTVVGVMGPDYLPIEADWQIWVPLRRDLDPAASHMALAANARLAEGVSPSQAAAEMRRLLRQRWLEQEGYRATDEELAGLRVIPLRQWIVGDVGSRLGLLFGAVGLVLLLGCANVATLVSARHRARRQELAVRAALGAGRAGILRLLLVESLVLAVAGATAGLGLAVGLLAMGRAHLPAEIPRAASIGVDAGALAFTLGLALLSSLAFGLGPALTAGRGSQAGELAASRRGHGARSRPASFRFGLDLGAGLVAFQVALAAMLAVGAGLLLRSFTTLSAVDPGFDPDEVAVLRPALPKDHYGEPEKALLYYRSAAEALQAVPGVESVGGIQFLPMTPGGSWTSYRPESHTLASGEQPPSSSARVVTQGYFATLRIPLLGGRDFEPTDTADSDPVVIVNQRLADQAWPGQDPVGETLLLGREEPVAHTVVGVVGNVRQAALDAASRPELYVPATQRPLRRMYLAARFGGGAGDRLAEVRAAVLAIDPAVPISNLGMLEQPVARSIAGPRFQTGLMSALALLGLVLGGVGVYGVMLYLVSSRLHDLGVRLALGATPGGVLASTMLRGAVPVALGLAVGLAAARATTGLLASSLYGIPATDPLTFAAVPAVLGAGALLAVLPPALRASRLDPVQVLRQS